MPKVSEKPVRVWLRNETCNRIVVRKMTYLRPDPRFVIKHDRRQTQLFLAARVRHGQTHPALLLGNRKIVAGLGPMGGARQLFMSHYPTIDVELLNRHELQRWVTQMVNLAKREGWPPEIPAIELQVLAQMDFGFALNFGGVNFGCIAPV